MEIASFSRNFLDYYTKMRRVRLFFLAFRQIQFLRPPPPPASSTSFFLSPPLTFVPLPPSLPADCVKHPM